MLLVPVNRAIEVDGGSSCNRRQPAPAIYASQFQALISSSVPSFLLQYPYADILNYIFEVSVLHPTLSQHTANEFYCFSPKLV